MSCEKCTALDARQERARRDVDLSGLLDVDILRGRHAETDQCETARIAVVAILRRRTT